MQEIEFIALLEKTLFDGEMWGKLEIALNDPQQLRVYLCMTALSLLSLMKFDGSTESPGPGGTGILEINIF